MCHLPTSHATRRPPLYWGATRVLTALALIWRNCAVVVTQNGRWARMAARGQEVEIPDRAVHRVVLDTNVVLDAWWFRDPGSLSLAEAIEGGHLEWVATAAMREELADVLGRPAFVAANGRAATVLAAYDRWARAWPHSVTAAPWRCADADDQIFIDLALSAGACWLFSRDRALLDLARGARARGCEILPPVQWRGGALAPP